MLGAFVDLGSTFTRWRTWFLMGNQDIHMRYRRSVLGPFWISLSMAAMVCGIAFLYGQIFDESFETYLSWLSAGFLVWFLINTLVVESCTAAVDAESHLRGIRIPLTVLMARVVHRNLVIFLHNLVVVIALLALVGKGLSAPALALPAGLAVILLVGFFGGLTLAALCLRFRDVAQVVANIMQVMFFLAPIIWMPGQGRVASEFVDFNPIHHLIELVRAPLLGAYASSLSWAVSLSLLAGLALLAVFTLSVSRGRLFTWL